MPVCLTVSALSVNRVLILAEWNNYR